VRISPGEAALTKGSVTNGESARRYAVLSIAAAVTTIGLKLGAYFLTGSVGLFSDAAESVVNLVAAVAALWALSLSVRPPDEEHAFGHNKAEYFSSGLESALIIIAAAWIGVTAWDRLMDPQPLQNVGLGLSVTLLAATLNGGVALVLLRAGRRLRSITLRADAQHLLTDRAKSCAVRVVAARCQANDPTGYVVAGRLGALDVKQVIPGCIACILGRRRCRWCAYYGDGAARTGQLVYRHGVRVPVQDQLGTGATQHVPQRMTVVERTTATDGVGGRRMVHDDNAAEPRARSIL
jgi:hypothetical protein